MTSLGRPRPPDSFGDVKMRSPTKGREALNDIRGIQKDVVFVDAKEHNKLGQDGFLKLLTHQLANQDPLNPMDQKQFAADLAQFSQLEQLANLNAHFKKTESNKSEEGKFYGASFLGKEIETQGTTLSYDGQADKVDFSFYLPKDAQRVMVKIFDSKKQIAAQIKEGMMPKGNNSLYWNGRMLDGTRAVSGDYFFEVSAYDEQYQEFSGQTKTSGIVTGVHFEDGETFLIIDHQRQVFLKDVTSFKLPDSKNRERGSTIDNFSELKKNAASSYSVNQGR